ncbi:helix-turn-helix domain-containing protein [Citrobacter braakii]|uniref:helix-turn-helix domain-containing protein n=1 Tax=Citrobacter braakii TaxID=57706 RepID=UPI001907F417|nr:helix-turn-helix domain-containing protein [Citrobacter braakii]MBJ8899658.1 helix-turn-helix domain-containing protein [Citrobacter braakii]
MIKEATVNEILKWIEIHLEERIDVENVVKFSGYSRRHIYTIFKAYTGMPIGKYIRQRKLCRAAYKLKLTSLSLAQIACSLEFDSQQSFSRSFKKLFGINPKAYRDNEAWDMSHLQAPFVIEAVTAPKVDICHLTQKTFYGFEKKTCEHYLDAIQGINVSSRWDSIMKKINRTECDLFFMTGFHPSKECAEKLEITTFCGTDIEKNKTRLMTKQRFEPEGVYAHFSYKGEWNEYFEVSERVYREILPKMKLKRRDSEDMEVIKGFDINNRFLISCDHYIPVMF